MSFQRSLIDCTCFTTFTLERNQWQNKQSYCMCCESDHQGPNSKQPIDDAISNDFLYYVRSFNCASFKQHTAAEMITSNIGH